ncbi:MAG: chromate transporter [Bacteroidales bacterium]|nr:chromate transporter [Bacteroidales bacterium]
MDENTLIVPESERANAWQIFSTFLKIGAFTIGGGYAMIPLIEREVVQNRQWINQEEFVELLALAQAAPGIIAMNIAVFVGHKALGMKGVFAATIGSILPSFLIILAIATVFTDFKENPVVESIFKGIRPAVVALIAVPIIKMVRTVHLTWKTAFIPVLAVILIYFAHLNPAWTIPMAAIGGILWSWLRKS